MRRDLSGRLAPFLHGAGACRAWSWPALSGVLLGLAFPTDPAGPLAFAFTSAWAWVALVPLLAILDGPRPPATQARRRALGWAFRRGWVTGGIFTLITMYWVAGTQGGGVAVIGGTVLMAAYLGLFTGAFAAGQTLALRALGSVGVLAAPFLWTAVEYLLSLGELGFPWLLLGHSQAGNPSLIQYAEYTGAYGVSFCIVLVNGLLYLAAAGSRSRRGRAVAAAAAAVCLSLPGLWGRAVLPPAAAPAVATGEGPVVGLVQNNLGLEKWGPGGLERAFASLERLSRRAVDDDADLLVWPETALPCRPGQDRYCREWLQAVVDDLGVPVFTGAPDADLRLGERYNAAFLAQPGSAPLQRYAKMHLVPFGERTPFRDSIPLLRDIDWTALTGDLGPAEFTPGHQRTLFSYEGGRFGALVCFESVFPDLVRRTVAGPEGLAPAGGADFLVIVTNDSWFGATAGPYQHARIAALRAVENRVPIARCATSGISLFIDAFGQPRGGTPLYEEAVRVAALAPRCETTIYTRHGDLLAGTCLFASLALLAWCLWRPTAPLSRNA